MQLKQQATNNNQITMATKTVSKKVKMAMKKAEMVSGMNREDMTWEELCHFAPKNMTWEECCQWTHFEGSWADECEREERCAARAALAKKSLRTSAKEKKTPVSEALLKKKVTTKSLSPLKITTTLPVTSDAESVDDTKDWTVVGEKKVTKVIPVVQSHVHAPVTTGPFVCPKCSARKSQFYPLCRECTDAEHVCPKCHGGKSPQYELCAKCTYNCPKCGGQKSPRFATCAACTYSQ